MLTLWNSLIQTLIVSEDLACFRLAAALISDKYSIACWVYSSKYREGMNLPPWRGQHSLGLVFSRTELDRFYDHREEAQWISHLRKCKREYDEANAME